MNNILPREDVALINFRPMLAASIDNEDDFRKLRYPLIASPKIDGIRTLIYPQLGPVTRSLKPIRNKHLRSGFDALMAFLPEVQCLDGELVAGDESSLTDSDIFNRTTSAVMSFEGEPDCCYWYFDYFYQPGDGYNHRMSGADVLKERLKEFNTLSPLKILPLKCDLVNSYEALLKTEAKYLAEGFEGIMLRDPSAPYKFGRATLKQGNLIKLKRFDDAEALILGFQELMENQNEDVKDSFGLAKRGSSKEGKVGKGTLGALEVECLTGPFKGKQFCIGTGFDQATRQEIWDNRTQWVGKTITFKYQTIGSVDAPRFPVFKAIRESE